LASSEASSTYTGASSTELCQTAIDRALGSRADHLLADAMLTVAKVH
jgi:hypothetical protein